MARAEDFLGEVLSSFDLLAPVVGAVRFGQGHINDTFEEAKAIGAKGFIDKPFEKEQLLDAFAKALS